MKISFDTLNLTSNSRFFFGYRFLFSLDQINRLQLGKCFLPFSFYFLRNVLPRSTFCEKREREKKKRQKGQDPKRLIKSILSFNFSCDQPTFILWTLLKCRSQLGTIGPQVTLQFQYHRLVFVNVLIFTLDIVPVLIR